MSKILHVDTSAYHAVIIGDPCNPPTPDSVAFAINTTDKGFLAPRLTATQITAVVSPIQGLLVFDITSNIFKFYDGASWVAIGTGSAGGIGPTGPQGLQGIQGPIGPTGPQGAAGSNGLNGNNGINGTNGPTGPQGPAGADGGLLLYKENGTPVASPIASGAVSVALGDGALSQAHGAVVQAAGYFSHSGDAQVGSYVMRGITIDAVNTEIFLNGTSDKLLMNANTTVAFSMTVVGRRTDASNEGAVYELRGGIDRDTTVLSTRIIGGVNKIVISEDNPPWDVMVDADTFTGALRIKVKGEAGKTIRWVAHIRTVEVIN